MEKKCRLCLSPCVVSRSLLSDNGLVIVESLTALQIKDDDKFSTIACLKCWLNINLAYRIQQSIIEADRKVKEDSAVVIEQTSVTIKQEDLIEPEILDIDFIAMKEERVDIEDDTPSSCDTSSEVIVIKGTSNEEKPVSSAGSLDYLLQASETTCAICGDDEKIKLMANHVRNHFSSKQTCEECNVTLDNITLYRTHFASVHANLQQTWRCDICFLTFQYKSLYNIHVLKAHSKKDRLTEQDAQFSLVSGTADCGYSLTCDICKKRFINESLYFKHLEIHKKKKCPICEAEITKYNFNKHVTMHSDGPSICHLCGVTCKNKDSLRGHLYYTHSKNKFPCDICGQTFKKSYSRLLHIRKEHTGEKNHTCETCGKSFFTTYCLSKHIKMTHLKLRPYICQHCNRGFSSRFAQRTHERQHTNDAPYRCDICGEGFRQNVSLRSHKKSKHNIVEEKKCQCKICGKFFVTDWAVKSHMRLH